MVGYQWAGGSLAGKVPSTSSSTGSAAGADADADADSDGADGADSTLAS
jgi:hypothetical protein